MSLRFSIITVTHNCSKSIVGCLDSVANQDHADYEHVVVDGASTDGTLELLNARRWQLTSLLSEPDNGIYDALNKGINNATGDIIGILHADDFFNGTKVLSSVAEVFRRHPETDVVIGGVEFIDPEKNIKKSIRKINSANFRPWMFRFGFMPAHTSTFVRRSLLKRIGYYHADYKTAGDFEFFMRLILVEKVRPFYLQETLVHMSVGGLSTSGWSSYKRTTAEILCCLRNNHIYSNWFFVTARLPIKFLIRCIFQLQGKLKDNIKK